MFPSKWLNLLTVVVLSLLLVFGWQTLTSAQNPSFLTSRVSRLETENSSLRSRLNRLESDVSRISSSIGLNYTYSSPPESGSAAVAPPSSDPMFDRLATLAIELRERIIILEEQVAELQGQSAVPNESAPN